MNDLKLKDLQLYKENDKYYLAAVFDQEDEKGVYELSVPKILFPIAPSCSMDVDVGTTIFGVKLNDIVAVDFGIVRLYAEPFDSSKSLYTKKLISEKTHEMTLEEIERELGYKIKIKENK